MEDNIEVWAKMSVCLLNMIMSLDSGLRLSGSEVFLPCINFANPTQGDSGTNEMTNLRPLYMFSKL